MHVLRITAVTALHVSLSTPYDVVECKIIALFALGNSYQDIRAHIAELYDIELSNGTINAVTDVVA